MKNFFRKISSEEISGLANELINLYHPEEIVYLEGQVDEEAGLIWAPALELRWNARSTGKLPLTVFFENAVTLALLKASVDEWFENDTFCSECTVYAPEGATVNAVNKWLDSMQDSDYVAASKEDSSNCFRLIRKHNVDRVAV